MKILNKLPGQKT